MNQQNWIMKTARSNSPQSMKDIPVEEFKAKGFKTKKEGLELLQEEKIRQDILTRKRSQINRELIASQKYCSNRIMKIQSKIESQKQLIQEDLKNYNRNLEVFLEANESTAFCIVHVLGEWYKIIRKYDVSEDWNKYSKKWHNQYGPYKTYKKVIQIWKVHREPDNYGWYKEMEHEFKRFTKKQIREVLEKFFGKQNFKQIEVIGKLS